MIYYILDGHTPVACDDLIEWAQKFEKCNRRVAEDFVNGVRISTVFLGLDHNFFGGRPILFETLVFPENSFDELDGNRYHTWAEAEAGHKEMVEKVRAKLV